jgi:DNA-binding NarL/FixJ family response regulator
VSIKDDGTGFDPEEAEERIGLSQSIRAAREAVEVIAATDPDLVPSDLHMPEGGGIALAKAVSDRVPVVMLTVSEAESDLLDAIAAGALGYLVKSTPPDELREQLWKAAKGEPVFSPSLAALVLTEFRKLHKTNTPGESLSEREREVLQLVPADTPTKKSAKISSSPPRPSRTTCATF